MNKSHFPFPATSCIPNTWSLTEEKYKRIPGAFDRHFVCTRRWVWKLISGDVVLLTFSYITVKEDFNTGETVVQIRGLLFLREHVDYSPSSPSPEYGLASSFILGPNYLSPEPPLCQPPHVFHPASNQDACYIPENGDDPWVPCTTQPCLNRYNTQQLINIELPSWLHVITQLQELAIQKAHRKPKTESHQGTSTPTNQPSKPNPVPETPPNNPPEPNDPTPPPSLPTIPSAKGPSVAPRRPPTPPSPDPSDPNNSVMADTPPIRSNGTSERGRKPDAFNGERSKAKQWLALFNNYLHMNKGKYPTKESQVSLFLSFFTGEKGGDWATQRLIERDADEEDENLASTPGEWRWITLKQICDRFKKDFKALASEDVVRTKIKFARMKGTDISSYNSIFDTYREESEFREAVLLEFYQDGLPPKLQEAVGRMYPKWDDFEEYKERAVELHLEWLKEWERQGRWRTTSTKSSPGANSSFNLPPKLTPDERDRLQKAGACFACRQTGHMSNKCPTFLRTSSQNTSRTFPSCAIQTAETASPPPVTVAQASSSRKHDQGNLQHG
ncbi:hypothetical protein D9758_019027 [Tetrapyrgos nigripes]|uniref:CCHC-type domain-containing protein n=1 Tax=Tetrapyrgos nigripes TaxID=182062 RepID=A0A8H5AYY7_9AGAR|nr:hypothetical protein D9758_019027 [Tetrapyrgos nigripes]